MYDRWGIIYPEGMGMNTTIKGNILQKGNGIVVGCERVMRNR